LAIEQIPFKNKLCEKNGPATRVDLETKIQKKK